MVVSGDLGMDATVGWQSHTVELGIVATLGKQPLKGGELETTKAYTSRVRKEDGINQYIHSYIRKLVQ